MIARLLAVELRRLAYRRAARVTLLVVFGLVLVMFGNEFRVSEDLSEDQLRQRRIEMYGDVAPPADVIEPGQPPPELEGGPEYYFGDPRFVFRKEMPSYAIATGVVVAVAAFVFGATAGGADWAAGTVQALLFWEPRRVRVMVAKAVALAAAVLAVALAVQLLSYGLGAVVAAARGNFDGADAEFWRELLGRSLRLSTLAVFTSLLAFGIAGFTRNTGAALGVGFVYFVVMEMFVRFRFPRTQPYLLMNNIEAWVLDGVPIELPRRQPPFFEVFFNSGSRAAFVLGLYLIAVVGAMTAAFARRDVT